MAGSVGGDPERASVRRERGRRAGADRSAYAGTHDVGRDTPGAGARPARRRLRRPRTGRARGARPPPRRWARSAPARGRGEPHGRAGRITGRPPDRRGSPGVRIDGRRPALCPRHGDRRTGCTAEERPCPVRPGRGPAVDLLCRAGHARTRAGGEEPLSAPARRVRRPRPDRPRPARPRDPAVVRHRSAAAEHAPPKHGPGRPASDPTARGGARRDRPTDPHGHLRPPHHRRRGTGRTAAPTVGHGRRGRGGQRICPRRSGCQVLSTPSWNPGSERMRWPWSGRRSATRCDTGAAPP